MTYDEALQALQRARTYCYSRYNEPLSIHNGLTQAIEVVKRMKADLDDSRNCPCCGRELPLAYCVNCGL